MLDLDHPMTKHVFAAARAEDTILQNAKRVTVSVRRDRLRVRDGCAPAFAELRRLARDHFADRPAITCRQTDAVQPPHSTLSLWERAG